jgi:cell division protein FtsI (penicillin-binding protein 3)
MNIQTSHPIRLQDKKKLVFVAFFTFCLFSFLILQFFKIQVVEGEKWLQKAKSQHQFVISEPFKRGIFYSNGFLSATHEDPPVPLVTDLPMFHLYIDPESIPLSLKDKICEHLFSLLTLEKKLYEKTKEEFYKKSRSRKIAMWLTHQQKELVEAWWGGFAKKEKIAHNALYFVQDYKRCYPYTKFLGQVLQTIREDKDVKTHQAIPTGGLEYYFDAILQGKEGKRRLLRSPKFPLDKGDIIEVPQHGHDVYLTIHHHIQAIAEEEIEKAVLAADAKSGWAAVMDVHTGDILALAQYPFFYPSEYRKFYSDKKLAEHTRVKAIVDCFEPGSTIKPISFAIALKANKERILHGHKPLFYPEEKVDLRKIKLPGRKIPMKDITTSQFLNMDLAVQKSSNIYIAGLMQKVVEAFGEGWYKKQLHEVFGFGKKTEIELPSETAGFLPCPGKCYSNGKLQWSTPTPGCLAIGYNLLVNSIQMLKAYSMLANGGYEVQPSLVKKIVNPTTQEIIYERKSLASREPVLDTEITERVISSMKYATKPGGTASRADIPGYTEVGKTSTSEKIKNGTYAKNVHVVTFIGFAPAKNAKIAVLVGIDEPAFRVLPGVGGTYFGGKCAAPAFREISKHVLHYLGVPPDDPYGYPKEDPRYDENKADMIKEVKQLRELFYEWHKR